MTAPTQIKWRDPLVHAGVGVMLTCGLYAWLRHGLVMALILASAVSAAFVFREAVQARLKYGWWIPPCSWSDQKHAEWSIVPLTSFPAAVICWFVLHLGGW